MINAVEVEHCQSLLKCYSVTIINSNNADIQLMTRWCRHVNVSITMTTTERLTCCLMSSAVSRMTLMLLAVGSWTDSASVSVCSESLYDCWVLMTASSVSSDNSPYRSSAASRLHQHHHYSSSSASLSPAAATVIIPVPKRTAVYPQSLYLIHYGFNFVVIYC